MNIAAVVTVTLLVLGAAAALWLPAGSPDGAGEPSGSERMAARFFGFFGIGQIPLDLALAVLFSSSAVALAAIDLIANLHFGEAYPAWFPLDALATGLGIGLLNTRALAASYHNRNSSDTHM
ncbi:MAG: hypothetical protein MJE77_47030 [Proteobacteria bacterium]|nr:hypothetical protein [Pseudomonadota bacterium]